MKSVRTRITVAVVGCTALVVAVAAIVVAFTSRTMLLRSIDERLRQRSRWFTMVPKDPSAAMFPFAPPTADRTPRDSAVDNAMPSGGFWFEVHDATTGEEIYRANGLPKELSLAKLGIAPGEPIRTVAIGATDRRARLLATRIDATVVSMQWPPRNFTPETAKEPSDPRGSGETRAIVVYGALEASTALDEFERLVWTLAAVWGGATALSWFASMGLARTILKPVESVSRTIAQLSPDRLSARVPMDFVPIELATVVTRLNDLLARVETAFDRERVTISNIAHELRTPIAALRATLEFALLAEVAPKASSNARPTLEASLALTLRMQSLVASLLTLTRIEAGQELLANAPVDLVKVLRDAWSTVERRAQRRGTSANWRVPAELTMVTSPAHVELIAANLLDNAVSHGKENATVEITLARSDAAISLEVVNHYDMNGDRRGTGDESSSPFQPFFRADGARSDERHFGLGLALCDRVVRLLGGTIDAKSDQGRFAVAVTFQAGRTA